MGIEIGGVENAAYWYKKFSTMLESDVIIFHISELIYLRGWDSEMEFSDENIPSF